MEAYLLPKVLAGRDSCQEVILKAMPMMKKGHNQGPKKEWKPTGQNQEKNANTQQDQNSAKKENKDVNGDVEEEWHIVKHRSGKQKSTQECHK